MWWCLTNCKYLSLYTTNAGISIQFEGCMLTPWRCWCVSNTGKLKGSASKKLHPLDSTKDKLFVFVQQDFLDSSHDRLLVGQRPFEVDWLWLCEVLGQKSKHDAGIGFDGGRGKTWTFAKVLKTRSCQWCLRVGLQPTCWRISSSWRYVLHHFLHCLIFLIRLNVLHNTSCYSFHAPRCLFVVVLLDGFAKRSIHIGSCKGMTVASYRGTASYHDLQPSTDAPCMEYSPIFSKI